MTTFVKFALYVILNLTGIFSGWVLSVMWGWFIWTQFHTVHLTIASAIGISMVVRYLTLDLTLLRRPDLNPLLGKSDFWTDAFARIVAEFVIGGLVLGVGYIVHLFVPVLGR